MKTSIITYFGQDMVVACDGKCNKAWGIMCRPKVQLSNDEDDFYFLSDNELGDSPEDPGTYEGGDAKPWNSSEFPNKWCARQCERSEIFEIGEKIELFDYSNRLFNKPFKHLSDKV